MLSLGIIKGSWSFRNLRDDEPFEMGVIINERVTGKGSFRLIDAEKGTSSLLSSINELYVEGRGWMERDSFFKEFIRKNFFLGPTRPVVDRINASYRNLQNGGCGQIDISPICFNRLVAATKEYEHQHRMVLDKKISTAKEKAASEGISENIDPVKTNMELDRAEK